MKCPFQLPVQPKDSWEIIDKDGNRICLTDTTEQRDYIVQAINNHEKLYRKGYEDGLWAFAWWKDGIQYVGSCGTTLEQALKEAEKK